MKALQGERPLGSSHSEPRQSLAHLCSLRSSYCNLIAVHCVAGQKPFDPQDARARPVENAPINVWQLDCVEVAPVYDSGEITALLGAAACYEMISLVALRKTQTSPTR